MIINEILKELSPKGKRSMMISIAAFTVYGLSGAGLSLTVLLMLKEIMQGGGSLYPYWAALCVCLLLKGISNVTADMQKHITGFDTVFQIRKGIVEKLKLFSLSFYTNERLGEIDTIIHKDVDNMEMVVGHAWTRMTGDFIATIIIGGILFFLNPPLMFVVLSALAVALLLLFVGFRKTEQYEKTNGDCLADMAGNFAEYVKGLPLLKAFSQSGCFNEKLDSSIQHFGEASRRLAKIKAFYLARYDFFASLPFMLTCMVGAAFVLYGKSQAVQYLVFTVLAGEFFKPFYAMQEHWLYYVKVTDSYKRILKVTKAETVKESKNPKTPVKFDISFENVSFLYGGKNDEGKENGKGEKNKFEMKDISFYVPEKSITVLAGQSGAGKTTITNLLLRFWDSDSGAIKIGGIDIKEILYDELLSFISIVMQDVQLFSDTIEANIKAGKRNASFEEVKDAAKKARIHEFIETLPEGYKTKIGENGAGLSGGQKQRLSIARAFLKNAPIVILDEMTSSVDPINEVLLQEAVTNLAENRTVIMIAHNLRPAQTAAQICVFKNGKLIEKGTHGELQKTGMYYRKLLETGGF